VRNCCKQAWLGAMVTAEGTIQVWKQASKNMPTKAFGMRVMIYNTDAELIRTCEEILTSWGVSYSLNSRMTSKVGTKLITEIHVQALASVITLLEHIEMYLMGKREFALNVLQLANSRKESRMLGGIRTPWTAEQIAFALQIRENHMPYRKRANGETLTGSNTVLKAIPCQAKGSVISTLEGVETRSLNNVSNNTIHECPASSVEDEEIVRSSEKSEQEDKEPLKDIG